MILPILKDILPLVGLKASIKLQPLVDYSIQAGMAVLCMIVSYNAVELVHNCLFATTVVAEAKMAGSDVLNLKACINDIPNNITDSHEIKVEISKCLVKSSV